MHVSQGVQHVPSPIHYTDGKTKNSSTRHVYLPPNNEVFHLLQVLHVRSLISPVWPQYGLTDEWYLSLGCVIQMHNKLAHFQPL